jgi:hypothetical protein
MAKKWIGGSAWKERSATAPKEAWLRSWVRATWAGPGDLAWVEAARGGTPGVPDLFMPVPGIGFIPVELKAWDVVNWKVKMEARPVQRRFHLRAAKAGVLSIFVSALPGKIVVVLSGEQFIAGGNERLRVIDLASELVPIIISGSL